MRNIWRLSLVFIIGVVSFLFAVNKLNRPPFASCQQDAHRDASYSVTMDEKPSVDITRYHLYITRNDKPVDGAAVCLRADMGGIGGMSGMGVTREAVEQGPGQYVVSVTFAMGGAWRGAVVIQDPQSGNVEVPLQLDVAVQ